MMINLQLCYIDTDSVIINTKTSNFFNDKSKDIEERIDTFNYEVERTLTVGSKKKVISPMKDGLSEKTIK